MTSAPAACNASTHEISEVLAWASGLPLGRDQNDDVSPLYDGLSMSDIDERYQRVTGEFTARARAVPLGAWDNPSPCAGWTARDVVGHLTGWIPGFFGAHGVKFPPLPSVQDDPVAAWETVQATLAAALSDPALAARPVETPFSTQSLAETVDMIVTGDVFTHTWDLARALGRTRRSTPPSSNG